jgi:phage shock protein A
MVARAVQARAGGGAEGLGAKSGSSAFNEFRRMEEKIEGRDAEHAAMAEVDEALGKGSSADALEAKFRELERSQGGAAGPGAASNEIDEELAALKKRIRVG